MQHFTIQKPLILIKKKKKKNPLLCRYVLETLAEGLPLLSRHYKLEQDPKAVSPLHTNMLTLLPALTQAFRNWQSWSGTGLPPSLTYTVTSHRGRSSQPDTHLIVSNLHVRSPILLGLPQRIKFSLRAIMLKLNRSGVKVLSGKEIEMKQTNG